MLAAIKSEIRKLLTIRFTYGLILFLFFIVGLFAFYVTGWHTDQQSFMSPDFLQNNAMSAVHTVGLAIGLISILLVTHEYRYNTIIYSLTANKSRTQVFFAKFLVVAVFSIFLTLVFAGVTVLLASLAINLRGFELTAQSFMYGKLFWIAGLVALAYSSFGYVIAMLLRSQVGAIAAMFLMPSTIEPLLGILLKSNQVYLPYTAISGLQFFEVGSPGTQISKLAVAIVVYIATGLFVSLLLFLRRDAN